MWEHDNLCQCWLADAAWQGTKLGILTLARGRARAGLPHDSHCAALLAAHLLQSEAELAGAPPHRCLYVHVPNQDRK